MKLQEILVFGLLMLLFLECINANEKGEEPLQKPPEQEQEDKTVQGTSDAEDRSESQIPEDKKYELGSLCNYCSYCKFCTLCDKDCPCKKSKTKPNCDLCKYCKYCSLCSTCDVVCTPGGFLDTVSAAIYNNLPAFDKETKESVDKDIEKAKKWIKEYL